MFKFPRKRVGKYVVQSKLDPVYFDTREQARLFKKLLRVAKGEHKAKIYQLSVDKDSGYEDYEEIR